jgi:purine-binding chemotaxis protein CheW
MNQYLTFFIRDEEYGVDILRVKEILEYEHVTRVPTTPAHVRGVINLRGGVLPVVDLAAKFGHEETAPTRTTCIVVVETRPHDELLTLGIVATAVSEVVDIPDTAIEPPPSFGTGVRVDYLTGMAKLDGRLALILDIDRVLSPVEIQQTILQVNEAADEVAAVEV